MLRAVIWDVDGTIAETERDGHRVAFNQALRESGVPWQWDVATYGRLLRVTGGIDLRPGVARLVDASTRAGIALAIATTTSRSNVDALLAHGLGEGWQARFGAVVWAEDAPRKKPDPMAYRLALERLGVAASDALAIEDSPNGFAAADAAAIAVLITRSEYFAHDVYPMCAGVCGDLDGPVCWNTGSAPQTDLTALRAMHAAWHRKDISDSQNKN